jgi:hypothetical protein
VKLEFSPKKEKGWLQEPPRFDLSDISSGLHLFVDTSRPRMKYSAWKWHSAAFQLPAVRSGIDATEFNGSATKPLLSR